MSELAYRNYWLRKRLLAAAPNFKCCRWWPSVASSGEGLSEADTIIYQSINKSNRLLDVGAGDLSVMRMLQNAGYRGTYHTQDISTEYEYTYRDLSEVKDLYSAVLFRDVLEHLTLDVGMKTPHRLVELLEPGGVLIVQTPNALCCRNQLGTDMTHKHCYNLADLWAHLSTYDLHVDGYRVVFAPPRLSAWASLRFIAKRFVASYLLDCDYAENIMVIARRKN